MRIVIIEGANSLDELRIEPASLGSAAEVDRFIARLRLVAQALWDTPIKKPPEAPPVRK